MTSGELSDNEREVLDLFQKGMERKERMCADCGVRYGLHSADGHRCPPFNTEEVEYPPRVFRPRPKVDASMTVNADMKVASTDDGREGS